MRCVLLLALLQVATTQVPAPARQDAATAPQPGSRTRVQLGVRIVPESVTVGQRFKVLVQVRAPRGAAVRFPLSTDSAAAVPVTATRLSGPPAQLSHDDSAGVTARAAYGFTAWDIGSQPLLLPDIVVIANGQTGYVSLATRRVFVKSVLSADTLLRVPKPPRAPVTLVPFNWLPWLALAVALLVAALLWRLWQWYRRRASLPLPPFVRAEREFARIEALGLARSGEGERHVALMTEVMRDYLAGRIAAIERSQTSTELLASASAITPVAPRLGDLLWQADLVKFARRNVSPEEAEALGQMAREIVQLVESHVLEQERGELEKKAA